MGKKLLKVEIGQEFNKKKIKAIGGQSKNILVYVSEDNLIGWEEDGLDKNLLYRVSSELSLLSQMVSCELPEPVQFNLRYRIAIAAFCAFSSNTTEEAMDYFEPVREIVKRAKTPEESKVIYTASALVITLILILILYLISGKSVSYIDYYYTGIAGCVGALLSIMFRADHIKIKSLTKLKYLFMQVVIKVVLGLFSGILLYISVKADVIFTSFKNNPASIILFAIMAGFSERFIPDFMGKLEKYESKKSIKNTVQKEKS